MSNRVTKELVMMARKHYRSLGEHPSLEKIRAFITFGSISTINKLNNEILFEERMKILQRTIDLPEDLG